MATTITGTTIDTGRVDTDLIKSKTNTPLSFQLSDGTAVGNFSNTTGALISNFGLAVGGTGAANTLSDYETGTWTPSFVSVNSTSPTGVFAHAGSYTKIGRTVSICCYMQVSSGLSAGGGTLAIAGIPFSSIDSNGHRGTGALLASRWDPDRTENIGVSIYDANKLGFLTSNHDSAWNWEQTGSLNNQTNMRFSMTYFTNS